MPQYDWLEGAMFKKAIEDRIKIKAGEFGLSTYDNTIPDLVFGFARQNRQKNEQREMIREASQRRGMGDALDSLETLVRTASEFAKQEGSRNLTVDHVARAYKAKFCSIWPFC